MHRDSLFRFSELTMLFTLTILSILLPWSLLCGFYQFYPYTIFHSSRFLGPLFVLFVSLTVLTSHLTFAWDSISYFWDDLLFIEWLGYCKHYLTLFWQRKFCFLPKRSQPIAFLVRVFFIWQFNLISQLLSHIFSSYLFYLLAKFHQAVRLIRISEFLI